jgi:Lipocalin-like domain
MNARGMAATLAAAILVALVPTGTSAQSLKEQLVGSWTVVSVVNELEGKKTEPFGPNPRGTFMFANTGHYSVNIVNPDRPKFAAKIRAGGTPEEYKAAVLGNISTFGTYTVGTDGWVSYHIAGSSFPNWDGTDQKPLAEITGDQLKWMVPAASTANGESTVILLRRAK